jgi:hypothetical protein
MCWYELILVLVGMIFMHLIADYSLQGCLANLKQRSYWEKYDTPDHKYEDDYKAALLCHSVEWSICIHIPLIILSFIDNIPHKYASVLVLFIAVNTMIHDIVDDMKANDKSINLRQDQAVHIGQIIITWVFTIILFYCTA